MDKGKYEKKEDQKKKKKENNIIFIKGEWIKGSVRGRKEKQKRK
jgi:hypothetical protein